VRFVRANFLEPPPDSIKNNDLLTCIGVARHVPADREDVFFKFLRDVLTTDGVALVSFISERNDPDVVILDRALEAWANSKGIPNRHFSDDELAQGFRNAGFRIEDIRREPSKYFYDKLLVKARVA
jgi:cyclopropane fatty-acyl-phospholipid synthase-like methyltransferase